MKMGAYFIIITMVPLLLYSTYAFAFAGQTHKAITQETINSSILLGDYLNNQLGLSSGLATELELLGQFHNNITTRVAQEPGFQWDKTKLSILEWLKDGSELEDVPNPRARHHFYDPLRNAGLDNSERPWPVRQMLKTFSKRWYPDYWAFDGTGCSSFDRAIDNTGNWGNEYLNYYYWGNARSLFYDALKASTKTEREATLGSVFLILGHICHLLEDQGVPAHARNDFIWGHMVGGFYDKETSLKDGGNPFEVWVENQVKNNNNTIPSSWLTGAGSNILAFSKLREYWDSDSYSGSYIGSTSPDDWGLAERTNYQFLSFSTMFKNDGSLYVFPNPSKENAPVTFEMINGKKHYYRSGYDVPHLTRVSYTTYTSGIAGITTTYEEDTVEENNVYTDYAQRTIPRTINYTTGLVNYFFRGRTQLTGRAESRLGDLLSVKLYIKNKSMIEASPLDYKFGFKGGQFEVYWDDASGNRTKVSSITLSKTWDSASTLDYDEEMWINFYDTPANDMENAVRFIVVYQGNILKQPEYIADENDTEAIAVAVIDANHIHNTPTTAMLLARFDNVNEDWFDPAENFNNHGFQLHYTAMDWWQANEALSGRQINMAPVFVNNRDRIWIHVEDEYNGNWLFQAGDWDSLEFFPHIVENTVSYGWCSGTCTVSLWDIQNWQNGIAYTEGNQVGWDSPEGDCFEVYTCTSSHTSAASNQPGTGGNWEDYWLLGYPDVTADIDIDGISESNEENPGGTVQVGGALKKIYTMILSDWPDLWTNELNRGSATLEVLTGVEKIRIWDNPDKTGQPLIDQSTPEKTWQLSSETVPVFLYVEGISASSSAMDVRLKFTINYAGMQKWDKVNFTVQN